MKRTVAPFLTPPDRAVSHAGWQVISTDGDGPLPAAIQHWDYQTTLNLAAAVSVDRRLITEACHLDWGSGFEIVVMARSDHTRAEFLANRVEVPLLDDFDLAVEIEVPGRELGGRLALETILVVSDPKPLSTISPQRRGSILWRSTQATELEGTGSQFPTDTLDFAAAGLEESAGWQLSVDLSDPEARFMSAVRLTLNSKHPAIEQLLQGSKEDGTQQLLRTLNWDVTRQLAQVALRSDEVVELDVDFEDVTVAGVLRNLLGRIWPHENTDTLRNWQHESPQRIEVRLQHVGGLLK
jgi:hypothetical protein